LLYYQFIGNFIPEMTIGCRTTGPFNPCEVEDMPKETFSFQNIILTRVGCGDVLVTPTVNSFSKTPKKRKS